MRIRPKGKAPNRAGFMNFVLLIAVTLGLTAPLATTCRTAGTIAKNPQACNVYSPKRKGCENSACPPRR